MEERGRDSSSRGLLRMTCWWSGLLRITSVRLDGEVYGVVGEEVVCLGRDSSSRGLLRMTCWWSGLLRMTSVGLEGEVCGVVFEHLVYLGRHVGVGGDEGEAGVAYVEAYLGVGVFEGDGVGGDAGHAVAQGQKPQMLFGGLSSTFLQPSGLSCVASACRRGWRLRR